MKVLFYLLIFVQVFFLNAQTESDVDVSFGQYPGFNNTVTTIKKQFDGKILVGGNFTSFIGQNQNRLIRLNSDGTKDMTFDIGIGFDNTIFDIEVQQDGKILVGGYITTYNGETENRLIRLNSDGSKDFTFDIGSGFNNYISDIQIQHDGKILIGGNFTSFQGEPENRLIRLNSDGSKDVTFDIGNGFNDYVSAVKIQPDGKFLIGGNFTTYQGLAQNRFIRLNSDGSKDSTLDVGLGFNGIVYAIAVDANDRILVGGAFNSFQGESQNSFIRLNVNGTKDMILDVGTGFNNLVRNIIVQEDDKILLGGNFTTYKNETQNRIIRLNNNGDKDTLFAIGSNANSEVWSTYQSDEKILVGGGFSTYNENAQNGLIQLNADGTKDNTFNLGSEDDFGFNQDIRRFQYQSDGKLIAGGTFTTYQNVAQNRLIRFNNDGTKDTSFDIGIGFNGQVTDVILQPNGKILVSGLFTSYKGQPQNYLVRLNSDGTKDTSFDIGSGFNQYVTSIQLQPNGKILVAGIFTNYQNLPAKYLIRLNSDGSRDTTFNLGLEFFGTTFVIRLQSDGKIIIGGNIICFYQSQNFNNLIRLNNDGSFDTSFNLNLGSGLNSFVNAICLQDDDKILVGGFFNQHQGQMQNRLIRLNNNGTKDTTFDIGTGFEGNVYTIFTQSDGKILVGGLFTSYQGQPENSLIRLNADGTKDASFDIGTGFDNVVSDIFIQPDGKFWLAGRFTNYNGIATSSLVRLFGNSILSTSDFDTYSITLFPNPVSSVMNLNSETQIESLTIYDMQGKYILNVFNSNIVDVSQLDEGIYLMKINSAGNSVIKKFIKRN